MKKGIPWLILTTIVVLSLALASCGKTTTSVSTTTKAQTQTTTKATSQNPETTPQYGGNFVTAYSTNPLAFDDVLAFRPNCPTLFFTNESLVTGNWAKGAAGTNEWDYRQNSELPQNIQMMNLAENYEINGLTITYHLRHGIKWQNKTPTGSWTNREVDSDDVAYSIYSKWTVSTSYIAQAYPYAKYIESITTPDKYTVVVKTIAPNTAFVYKFSSDHLVIEPKDASTQFGNLGDWHNSIGTGAFMMSNYVDGNIVEFVRNPDFWRTDPAHPQNKLPYFDKVSILIVPDSSTRQSALRTGKIDQLGGTRVPVYWEDAKSIIKTNPDMKYTSCASTSVAAIYWRVDKAELPTSKLQVRQALHTAIDRKTIIDTVFGGTALDFNWPIPNQAGYTQYYKPLNQYPQSVQDMYSYNVDKAKQMLTAAGYPNGFKAEVLCTAPDVDMMSVFKNMWAKVNVDLAITVVERAVWVSQTNAKSYAMMAYAAAPNNTLLSLGGGFEFLSWGSGIANNFSGINDARLDATRAQLIQQFYLDQKVKIMAADMPYLLEQTYVYPLPAQQQYTFWQPWIYGYHGEATIGLTQTDDYPIYIWMDKAMKQQKTGQ